MSGIARAQEKKEREEKAIAEHERLSRLFRENRFAFERERRQRIEEAINSAKDESRRARLRELQDAWDRRLRKAGSNHNRFVLAQTFFGNIYSRFGSPPWKGSHP